MAPLGTKVRAMGSVVASGAVLLLAMAAPLLVAQAASGDGVVDFQGEWGYLVLIAPLAFCMGMPFPLGLSRVSAVAPTLVPWAWGINGCASVLSAVLATLLAIHVGFTGVVVFALVLYVVAAASFHGAPSGQARDVERH